MIAKNLKYAFAAALMVVCSCVENKSWDDESSSISAGDGEKTFNLLAAPYTRASVDQNNLSVAWTAGDRISLLDGEENREFKTEEGGELAGFSGYASEAQTYYAVYPYRDDVSLAGDVISFEFPQQQRSAAGNIPDPSASVWMGKSRGSLVVMNNLCATVAFSFVEDDVKSVTVSGNASEMLSGTVYVTFDGDRPVVTDSQLTGDSVTLLPASGEVFAAGVHAVTLLPGEFQNGIVLSFLRADSDRPVIKTVNTVTTLSDASFVDLGVFDLDAPELLGVSVGGAVASGSGASLSGSMDIERFNADKVQCGFEYRFTEEDPWTSVTCEPSAPTFSYVLKGLRYSSEPVTYRAWAMVNSYKIYSEESTFTMLPTYTVTFPFVVPDANYEENAPILSRDKWNFGTNGAMFKNKTDAQKNELNATEWIYPVDDKDFSFRFWCRIDHAGFCIRAITHDDNLPTKYFTYHGLCLNYTSTTGDGYSWILLPSLQGARLVCADVQLYDRKSLTLCSAVDAEGKVAAGSQIETLTSPVGNYQSIKFNVPYTEFNKRYYLAATSGRVTICNLTLTYQYE